MAEGARRLLEIAAEFTDAQNTNELASMHTGAGQVDLDEITARWETALDSYVEARIKAASRS